MSGHAHSHEFLPLTIAVVTVSDSRTVETDKSGALLMQRIESAGHHLYERVIVKDDIYQLRATASNYIADENVAVVIFTGGTGLTGRDVTPEAISLLFDKEISGFGELFRQISYEEIATSSLESRAIAGLTNGTLLFCVPGSTGACKTAWDNILNAQLDIRTRPCSLAEMRARFLES